MSRLRTCFPRSVLLPIALVLIWLAAACGGATQPAAVQAPAPSGETAAPAPAGLTAEEVAKMLEEVRAESASAGLSEEDVQKLVAERVAEAEAAALKAMEEAMAAEAMAMADAKAAEAKAMESGEDPYYKGKTIRVIANHPPGGGADLNARAVARHIGRFIPGNPKTVVLNKVGGASLVGAHYVWHADPDGLTIGVFTGVNPISQIVREGVQFNLLEFPSLGGLQIRPFVWYIRGDAPYRRIQDAMGKGSDPDAPRFTNGQDNICQAPTARGRFLKDVLDLPMDLKFALPGGRVPTMQQLERGDIQARGAGMWYTLARDRPGWQVDDTGGNGPDSFVQIFFNGTLPELQLRHNGEIDVPEDTVQIIDLLTDEQEKIWRILSIPNSSLYRASFAPPGTPDELVQVLRDAMEQMVQDPEFLADYAKILSGDEVTPTPGAEMMEQYEAALGDAEFTGSIFSKYLPECEFPGLVKLMAK